MRLILTPDAKRDLREAQRWYEQQRSGLGVALRDELDGLFALILDQPKLFIEIKPRVHRVPLRRFPYLVFYSLRAQVIYVLAILHHARDPETWKSRFESYRP